MSRGGTFLVEGVQRNDLNALERALGLTNVPVKVLPNAHRCGSLVRGLKLELPGTTPFPAECFALEGFNVCLGSYSFPRGAIGSAHSTESALTRCLERKKAEIEEALKRDPAIKVELGSSFAGALSIFRVNQSKWGISLKTHNDTRTYELLKTIGGTPIQDCTAAIQENQKACVIGNQTVAARLAEILGATLQEESMTLENTVMGSNLLLGSATVVFGNGNNVFCPLLIGTAELPLTPEQIRGEPFCFPWRATAGSLDLPNEDECMFMDLSPKGCYSALSCQQVTMQLPVETNVFFAVPCFPKLGFDGHTASWLNSGKASSFHSLATVRAITSQLNSVNLLDEDVHTELEHASRDVLSAPCTPSTVPITHTLAEAGRLFSAK